MTTVNVLFLGNCGDDRAGERKPIDAKRAKRLATTGYVEILAEDREAAVTTPAENAARERSPGRGPKPERRG